MSGRTNEADVQPGMMTEAVPYPGLMLTLKTTVADPPEYDLCDSEQPDGYSFNTTKDPITLVAGTNLVRGVVALIEGQEAEFVLLATNIEVNVGDLLETAAEGTVDGNAGVGWIVGKALTHHAINAGATPATMFVRARVTKYYKAA
jgi:hypothetical protein